MVLCFFLLNYHNSKTNENMVKKKRLSKHCSREKLFKIPLVCRYPFGCSWNERPTWFSQRWKCSHIYLISGISFAVLVDFKLHGSHFAGNCKLFCINFLCLLFNAALT